MVQPPFPDLTVLVQPLVDFLHFVNLQQVVDFSALAVLPDQGAFGQYAHVLGNGLPAHSKVLGNGAGRHGLHCYEGNNGSSSRISDSLKNISAHQVLQFGA